jgi:hypothetical protein
MSGLFGNDSSNQAIVIGNAPIQFPQNIVGEMTIDGGGRQRIVQSLPPLADLVRLGKSYAVQSSSAIAALTAVPTTVAAISLYNGETPAVNAAAVCYVIDKITAVEIVVDATQQNELAVFAMLNKTDDGFTPATVSLLPKSLSGKPGAYGGAARCNAGVTVINNGWFALGNSSPSASAVAGGAWRVTDIPINGLYIVRPGAQFNVHGSKIAATASQILFGIFYHEIALDLGA